MEETGREWRHGSLPADDQHEGSQSRQMRCRVQRNRGCRVTGGSLGESICGLGDLGSIHHLGVIIVEGDGNEPWRRPIFPFRIHPNPFPGWLKGGEI